MAIMHDFRCNSCSKTFLDITEFDRALGSVAPRPCPACNALCHRVFLPRGNRNATIAAKERTVYYRGPNGDIRIPGRNDVPMPEKFRRLGYQRVECESLADVRRLEREKGGVIEASNYDRNSSATMIDGVDVGDTK